MNKIFDVSSVSPPHPRLIAIFSIFSLFFLESCMPTIIGTPVVSLPQPTATNAPTGGGSTPPPSGESYSGPSLADLTTQASGRMDSTSHHAAVSLGAGVAQASATSAHFIVQGGIYGLH